VWIWRSWGIDPKRALDSNAFQNFKGEQVVSNPAFWTGRMIEKLDRRV